MNHLAYENFKEVTGNFILTTGWELCQHDLRLCHVWPYAMTWGHGHSKKFTGECVCTRVCIHACVGGCSEQHPLGPPSIPGTTLGVGVEAPAGPSCRAHSPVLLPCLHLLFPDPPAYSSASASILALLPGSHLPCVRFLRAPWLTRKALALKRGRGKVCIKTELCRETGVTT